VLHGATGAADLLAADKAAWAAAFEGQLCGLEVPPIFVLLDDGADVFDECFEFLGWHGVSVGL
jgi:hypothetical protein